MLQHPSALDGGQEEAMAQIKGRRTSKPIEDYGFISNMYSGALVCKDGSIDWLCLPRFDSAACFAALLGTEEHGRWQIAPDEEVMETTRRYRTGTMILETTFTTREGKVTVIDFMPLSKDERHVELMRLVVGVEGRVKMRSDLVIRFDYGRTIPWVRRRAYGISAVAGPDALDLRAPIPLHGENMHTVGEFVVEAGKTVPFTLAYHPSHRHPSFGRDSHTALRETEAYWREWSQSCEFHGEGHHGDWDKPVRRSLLTLKALTFQPTGGILAAATTSLPETLGGHRNWDYRYCWIRDATLTLYALLNAGYKDEAREWREWLLRAAAGKPDQMQIMYGLGGERRLTEQELDWLPGYENSKPVRIGNGAYDQMQIDVYGELMDALHTARRFKLELHDDAWNVQRVLMKHLEGIWNAQDEGIWEVRGGKRDFTHSRLMAWVAYDRAVKAIEEYGMKGPVDQWRTMRDTIKADILANGWSDKRKSFVQYYGGETLDASLLMMPIVGFLDADDPRIVSTVLRIRDELSEDGLILRYRTEYGHDGLEGEEGTFLVCSFWMVDALTLIGHHDEATEMFDRLLTLRNDLGLLAEEYHPGERRQLGNFPQAFSHIGLVNAASNLTQVRGPARHHSGG